MHGVTINSQFVPIKYISLANGLISQYSMRNINTPRT